MDSKIAKISKIKNLGLLFSDYEWDIDRKQESDLPEFKKFNLIYGWNGTGKTTLSRLFEALGGEEIDNLQYEIVTEDGCTYKQGKSFPNSVRVFNREYVEKNLKLSESKTNSISIVLGEENKVLKEKIEEDKKDLKDKILTNNNDKEELENLKKEVEKNYIRIAKSIKSRAIDLRYSKLGNYDKTNAREDLSKLNEKNELSNEEYRDTSSRAGQSSKRIIQNIDLIKIDNNKNAEIAVILSTTIESEIIDRLKENNDISQWVEDGMQLHKDHSSNLCEYCLQKISQDRSEALNRHFNEDYRNLKNKINELITWLRGVRDDAKKLKIPDEANFNDYLQSKVELSKIEFEVTKDSLLLCIQKHEERLKEKQNKTYQSLHTSDLIDVEDINNRIRSINAIIEDHNEANLNLEDVKEEAMCKIKDHLLSTVFDDIKAKELEIKSLVKDITLREIEISDLSKKIEEFKKEIVSEEKACEAINKNLYAFLGHNEIEFVRLGDSPALFDIKRGGNPAINLSEGEKTAIALIYFLTHLQDIDLNIQDSIVVIDDPISSLDSNFIFQAHAFLMTSIEEAGQVFIFTHSLEFLRLLIDWTQYQINGRALSSYYMIRILEDNARRAHLAQLDFMHLILLKNEYHFLFFLLKNF